MLFEDRYDPLSVHGHELHIISMPGSVPERHCSFVEKVL
jgi:hypothetical protein